MKALKIILWIVVILIAIVLIGALLLPDKVEMKRSIVIEKPADVVYDQVADFQRWPNWSPWHDTLISYDYAGIKEGEGSSYSWTHEEMGGGKQEIVKAVENEYIENRLQFERGGPAKTRWDFEETDNGTKVTWYIYSGLSFPVERWIFALSAKKHLESYFEKGLKDLKTYTESLEEEADKDILVKEMEIEEAKPVILLKDSATMDNMQQKIGASMHQLFNYMTKSNGQLAEPPRIRWHSYDPQGYSVFETVLVLQDKIDGEDNIKSGETYTGKVIMATHTGPYEESADTWNALDAYVDENKLEVNGTPFEIYVTDPETVEDESQIITDIYFPVAE